MDIETALPRLKDCVGKEFGLLFPKLMSNETKKKNKGLVGQVLQSAIGLKHSSDLTDFSDGELKTNKSDRQGNPVETMYIMQIARLIDTMICEHPVAFESSALFKKIQRIVFLPVYKTPKDPKEWFFVSIHDVNLNVWDDLRTRIESDYDSICAQLRRQILSPSDGFIHTTKGTFVQTRTKDAKTLSKGAAEPQYHPIYSTLFQRNVSTKNHAFYFQKNFMRFVRSHQGNAHGVS